MPSRHLLLFCATVALAHQQPATLAVLDVLPQQINLNLHLPVSELELALQGPIPADLNPYLLRHIRPLTPTRQPWQVQVKDLDRRVTRQPQSGPFEELTVNLVLIPPAGATTRDFIFQYDVILHQVVTHRAIFSIQRDWATGQTSGAPVEVGIVRVNFQTGRVDPLIIQLDRGSTWQSFRGMVEFGMHHIEQGADHLLFLFVLLLPAPLLLQGRQWGSFGGGPYCLKRLLQLVTAFTLGHSLTLLAGALSWFHPPQQPIEVLIAVSILVSAIHAIRPIFPGREIYIAAGFGLIHGMAFATGLADLHLSLGPLALSILGFNLGIELMQLFVIALTVPWVILLSLTPAYRWVRPALALLAAVAALGWVATRATGKPNALADATDSLLASAPLGLVILAIFAMLAYVIYQRKVTTPKQTQI